MGAIAVVAPYSPLGSCAAPTLGAAQKIESVLRILSRFGHDVLLINSAHNESHFHGGSFSILDVGAESRIRTYTPPMLPSRPLGKALNLISAWRHVALLKRHDIKLVWIYNGYSYESLVALIWHRHRIPFVLQLEDWPTARHRGLNPKPYLDLLLFRHIVPRAQLVTCVNALVADRIRPSNSRTMLLPGLLNTKAMVTNSGHVPFSGRIFTLGYFGTLTRDKGTNVLVDVIPLLPSNWKICVTGDGPDRPRINELAATWPERITYRQTKTQQELFQLVDSCDAVINPHLPISKLGNGVFPFKVFEALGADRLLISTELPDCGMDLAKGTMIFDGSCESLLKALSRAPEYYAMHKESLFRTGAAIRTAFSESSIYNQLENRLKRFL